MTAYRLNAVREPSSNACGHIGGSPHLPELSAWPRCGMCDSELIAFLEIELPNDSSHPFQAGSRLQIFGCCEHDDIAGTIYSDYKPFANASRNVMLPDGYWNLSDGHYVLRLLPPSIKTNPARREPRLISQFLVATRADDESEDGFKLFGRPYWLQDAEPHRCSCGAPMELIVQIPDGQGFPMAVGADEQPNSFSPTEYCIFLGNQLYVLGCTKQCDPKALWPILQH